MAKIQRSKDCGNSPKNKLVEDAAIHLLTANCAALSRYLTEDFTWYRVGKRTYTGKEELTAALQARSFRPANKLQIDHVASHGRTGFANGTYVDATGKRYGFCQVIEFGNTKGDNIRHLSSYFVVEK